MQGMFKRLGLLSGYDIEGIKRINLRLNGFSVGEIKQILREAYTVWGKGLTTAKF